MADEDDEAKLSYLVLVNHEEQYSLWRPDLDIPAGWQRVFGPGPKRECLDYVNEHWTDMRPLSLRRDIEASRRAAPPQ